MGNFLSKSVGAVVVEEPGSEDAYGQEVKTFQSRMSASNYHRQAEFSEQREAGNIRVRRFVAKKKGKVVGWMTLERRDPDLKILGICVDGDAEAKMGVAKALVSKAVDCSFRTGKGGVVSLKNFSHGSGDEFYKYAGFKPVDGTANEMRLTPTDPNNMEQWYLVESGEYRIAKSGRKIPVVKHILS